MRIEAHVAVCERATTARHVEVKPPTQIPWRSRVVAAQSPDALRRDGNNAQAAQVDRPIINNVFARARH
jgi:hypothetical protein